MALETGTYISDLVATNPTASDPKSAGDDHLRFVKSTVKATFPNVAGAVTMTHTELNTVTARGLIAGQTWTGTHTFPATTYGVTAAFGASGTGYATLDYVNAVATNAALPGQTGNAGKLMQTDGTTASFSGLLNAGVIRISDATDPTKLAAFSVAGIATGTTRTLTVQDKSGTVATLADGLALLAVLTPTAAAAVNALNVFSSLYDSYLVIGQGLAPATDAVLTMQLAVAGALDAGGTSYANLLVSGSTAAGGSSQINIGGTTIAAGTGCNFEVRIHNANSTLKMLTSFGLSNGAATPTFSSASAISAHNSGAATGIGFAFNGGENFAAQGSIRIYGIQKA